MIYIKILKNNYLDGLPDLLDLELLKLYKKNSICCIILKKYIYYN